MSGIYKRQLFSDIERHLLHDEITILIGSRQVGKTTLLKSLQLEMEHKGHQTFFFTLERLEIKKILDKNPENLFSIIPPPGKKRFVVFIDEIQYLENPTNFLKLLYDEYKGQIKLVVTGSSAFYIDRKFKDSLAGRKRIFRLFPFSLKEMVECRGELETAKYLQQGINNVKEIPVLYHDKLQKVADEYIIYGGYPRVVFSDDYLEKQQILNELVSSFLKKDALESSVRKESEFMFFVEVLADRIGSKLNRQEISNICGISDETVRNFFYVLQKSFHISIVRPFWGSKTSELRKMPKLYFQDNGLRNAVLHDFSPIALRKDKGDLAENMAYNLLRHHYESNNIQYWTTRDQNEVDFIINKENALEIKYNSNLIKQSKYKLFRDTYPQIDLTFACFKNHADNLLLWAM